MKKKEITDDKIAELARHYVAMIAETKAIRDEAVRIAREDELDRRRSDSTIYPGEEIEFSPRARLRWEDYLRAAARRGAALRLLKQAVEKERKQKVEQFLELYIHTDKNEKSNDGKE